MGLVTWGATALCVWRSDEQDDVQPSSCHEVVLPFSKLIEVGEDSVQELSVLRDQSDTDNALEPYASSDLQITYTKSFMYAPGLSHDTSTVVALAVSLSVLPLQNIPLLVKG